ncbi:MAG: glycosyltransferase family 4 protein [Thaumarchaeota archaeon]|nr:glycosyltransferase family 4 protein [Nitrososphaerota archaeon]
MRGSAAVAFLGLGEGVGGGQHEALAIAEALKEYGFRITLVCGSKPDFKRLERELGVNPLSDNYLPINRILPKDADFLRPLLYPICIPMARSDIYVNLDAGSKPFLIPLSILVDEQSSIVYHFINAEVGRFWRASLEARRRRRLAGRVYWNLLAEALKWIVKRVKRRGLFTAVCRFTAENVERILGVRPKVLYGPIEWQVYRWRGERKEDFMVSVARITPYKNLEEAIYAAKILNKRLVIFGAVRDKPYYKKLLELIRRERLEDRVKIIIGSSIGDRAAVLKRAKVFLHCSVEGFGKSIAEAMAAGCIPLVPRLGGQSEYTPKRFHYSSFEEMLQKIEEAFNAPLSISYDLSKIAMKFDRQLFKTRFIKLLEESGLI